MAAKEDAMLPYIYNDEEYIAMCKENPDLGDLTKLIRHLEGGIMSEDEV